MLMRLSLRNYLFVRQVNIDFAAGFGVITGETGAGKSLLLGALMLLAGGRAGADRVRPDTDAAEIEAAFSLSENTATSDWLREHALLNDDDEALLLVRRVVATPGGGRKSAAFINGRQTPLAQLGEIVSSLMDICGQHAHYSLRDITAHRELLDTAAKVDITEVAEAYHAWKRAEEHWQAAVAAAEKNAENRTLLGDTLADLAGLDFSDEKWRQMNDDLTRTAHVTDLADGCAQMLAALDDGTTGVLSGLTKARRLLSTMQRHDNSLSAIQTTLSDATDLLNEVERELSSYADTLSVEPEKLRQAEQFIAECHRLARKYGVSDVGLLGTYIAEKQAELQALADDAALEVLQAAAAAAQQKLDDISAVLSRARQRAAKTFADAVNGYLQKLAMSKARLSVVLTPYPQPTASGAEKVEFQIATRPDMPPGAITSVASGGELSRLGLAIHLAAERTRTIPVTIFDEVDAGIGGAMAGIVGVLLRNLGKVRQVLCVTHLPQVAACANVHWRVGGKELSVVRLTDDERVEEIARMNSGEKITATARRHAAEMLSQRAV